MTSESYVRIITKESHEIQEKLSQSKSLQNMSDSDLEEQRNELLVIKEILGEECIQLFTSKEEVIEELEAEFNISFFQSFQCPDSRFGGRLDISPSLNEDLKLSWSSSNDNVTVEHLPPITIEFCQPLDYPSKSSPAFKLTCLWLTSSQLQLLEQEFKKIASDNDQLVILYLWISVIKDDLFTLLEINDDLNVQPLIPKVKKPKPKLVQLSYDANIDWTQRYQGQIKKFNHERGFGFITNSHDLKAELFFHITEFLGNQSEIKKESSVSFDLKKDEVTKKVSAVKVQVIPDDQGGQVEDAKELPDIVKMLKMHNEDQEAKIFQKSIFDCNVCLGEKTGRQCLRFTPCNHVFCNDCMKSYFEVQIKEGQMSNLTCPMDKCTCQALPTQVQTLVSAKSFQLYEQVLLSTTLESMADVVLCPRRHCQCPTIIDREASMGQCPNCTFVFCIYCKASFHGVAPCRYVNAQFNRYVQETQHTAAKLHILY